MNFEKCKARLMASYHNGDFNNAYFMVGRDDNILFEHGINADKSSVFDLASISKVIGTTMVTLRMVDAGMLTLGDTITDFFDDVPLDKKAITIKHLLTHTAGFAPFVDLEKLTNDPAEVIAYLLDMPLTEQVGKQVIYSCLGFILLGKILEQVGHDRLDNLAKKYVFDPLDLTATTYHPNSYTIPTENKLTGVVHDENARYLKIAGNAGVFASANDLTKFVKNLVNDKNNFLSTELYDIMVQNHTEQMNENRGLGVKLYRKDDYPGGDSWSDASFGHTGFTGTSFFIDPALGLYVVLLTNRVYHQREDNGFLARRRSIHADIISEIKKESKLLT